jgi:phosphoglycerate kinase
MSTNGDEGRAGDGCARAIAADIAAVAGRRRKSRDEQAISKLTHRSGPRSKERRMRTIMDGLSRMDDIDVEGRRVLLRTDFNVPLTSASGGAYATVADDTRIRAALPTIEELLRRGARLVLVSHLDRPRCLDPGFSMRPVAERLAQLTGASVPLAPGVTGAAVRELTEGLAPGAMLMLENLRSAPGETQNDPRFASALAELADLYVDDAFGSADQAHASTQGVAYLLPSAAGRLMEREILALSAVVDQPARPLVAILGGTDVGDEIQLVRRFVDLADAVCIGGAMCLPFLCVVHGVGCSLWPPEDLEPARLALAAAAQSARAPIGSASARGGNADGHRTTYLGPARRAP